MRSRKDFLRIFDRRPAYDFPCIGSGGRMDSFVGQVEEIVKMTNGKSLGGNGGVAAVRTISESWTILFFASSLSVIPSSGNLVDFKIINILFVAFTSWSCKEVAGNGARFGKN